MRRSDKYLMVVIVVVGCVITIFAAERIGVNGGLGWDGRAYAHWAKDLPAVISRGEVDSFQAQRLLPSAVIHYGLGVLGVERSDANVIMAFQVLDALMLLVSCLCLCRIATALSWSRAATWAAFASMFGGFAIARHALYNPVLTDATAFCLGSVSLVGFVERRSWVLMLSALVATFVWPALIILNAAALCLSRRTEHENSKPASPWLQRIRGVHFGVFGACVGGGLMLTWFLKALWGAADAEGMAHILGRSHRDLWPVTVATFVAMGCVSGWFLGSTWNGPMLASYLGGLPRRALMTGGLFVVALLVVKRIWVERVSSSVGFDFEDLQFYYVGNALRAPLWSAVHHVVYLGPLVLLIFMKWRRIASATRDWGLAASVLWASVVFISVTPETRHLIAFVPWIVVFSIHATRGEWTRRTLGIYLVLTLVWSKVWFVIGYNAYHDSYRFPDQRYMMNLGPWATDATFVGHAIAVALTGIVLWIAFRNRTAS